MPSHTAIGSAAPRSASALVVVLVVMVAAILARPLGAQQTQPNPEPQVESPADNSPAVDSPAGNAEVARVMREFEGRGDLGDDSPPRPPEQTVAALRVAEDLRVELVAAEPAIAQPIHISFDTRGRMWVVQYRQYPFPEGLKVVRYDQHLRAVFDRVPNPPPHHVPGADVVTVFEDRDGDGSYETQRDVITGLNIATSVAVGGGGIWVMNPPYLLRYPDADGDAVPDGDPVVHLSGFGLEDTHSVANSIMIAPDGWLYGVNGSTTTARVRTPLGGSTETAFQGQCVWRYHPQTYRFEIYAEGGGNPFGLEFDSGGRVFSGTNHGNTRGMHYRQGGYGTKNWGKHGPLTNPYAFGYLEHMGFEGDGRRFTQEFVIYEDRVLPARYHGQMLAINPLHRVAFASRLIPHGSTYRTEDFENLIETEDRWFRPVDCVVGPDGAVYVADWYDTRLTHVDPRDTWHKASGRIYRIAAAVDAGDAVGDPAASGGQFFTRDADLSTRSSAELVPLLEHSSRWFRFAAIQELADRGDRSVVESLWVRALQGGSPGSLEALWAVVRIEGYPSLWADQDRLARLLAHPEADVRRWTLRLLGDAGDLKGIESDLSDRLLERAAEESDPQTRAQLASTAARLSGGLGGKLMERMLVLDRDADLADPHIPLLIWWALEAEYRRRPDEVLARFEATDALWKSRLVRRHVLERLARRVVLGGEASELELAGAMLHRAPDRETRASVMRGIELGLAERGDVPLPEILQSAIDRYRSEMPGTGLRVQLRQRDPEAFAESFRAVASSDVLVSERVELIEILGETRPEGAMRVLAGLLGDAAVPVRRAALSALSRFDDPQLGQRIATAYQAMDDRSGLRPVAIRALASRPEWARQLVAEIDSLKIPAETVPPDVVAQMQAHDDEQLNDAIERLWGRVRSTPEDRQRQIERLRSLVASGTAYADRGAKLYAEHCGKCHRLFGDGGEVGPDLTGYERDNFEFLALAVVDPSAAIREEFTGYQILTTGGQVLTGLLVDQTENSVTLRTVEGESLRIAREEIESLQASPASLMPDGLLDPLTDQQVRDLFGYLSSPSP